MYPTTASPRACRRSSNLVGTEVLAALRILLGAVAVLLLLPVAVLFTEVMLATKRTLPAARSGERRRLAIIMPAHNEASVIAESLRSLIPQLHADDRLIVVADNCTDETAAIAVAEGAHVIERNDRMHRGKGYALDFGVRHLKADPPDTVIIVDSDCVVAAGCIERLAVQSALSARPVQALYLMHAGKNAGLKMKIAEFAWVVKNQIRPTGLHRLGLPCQLMGTGMAFPWECLSSAALATGHIVEDLKLGIDLALSGAPPSFCPDALVTSNFPTSTVGIEGQRTRWEHGHLSVIASEAPRLFWRSLLGGNPRLLALALDLSVPPLALLTLLVIVAWAVSGMAFALLGSPMPFAITSVTALLLGLSILVAWVRYGRRIIDLRGLVLAALYPLMKLPLYAKFLFARQTDWVRSRRDADTFQSNRPRRLMYAAGPGDVIGTFRHWREGRDDPGQVSMTYSGQFYDVCQRMGANGYVLASHPRRESLNEGLFRIEHRRIPLIGASGVLFHVGQIWMALWVTVAAIRYRADTVVICDATCHWFPLSVLPWFRIKVIPTVHCVLWTREGVRGGAVHRLLHKLDQWFWRKSTAGILSASHRISRQIRETAGSPRPPPIIEFLPTYREGTFVQDDGPSLRSPFRLLFAGRIEPNKGIFDLLEIAKRLRSEGRTDIEFDLCGTGSAVDALTRQVTAAGLTDSFRLHGHCDRLTMRDMFRRAHVLIVPTTSQFIEGFNQVVVEGVLAGRPIITSNVCPAVEYVRAAIAEVPPDDVGAYHAAILGLRDSVSVYETKRAACLGLQHQFYDTSRGWSAALIRALESLHTVTPSNLDVYRRP